MINTMFSAQKNDSTVSSVGLSATVSSSQVDSDDEAKASIELLHLIIALRSGTLGSVDLSEKKCDGEAGPQRSELEQLKEVIRRIRSGNDRDWSAKNAQGGKNGRELSLKQMLDSLPEELRNLVYSAFPKLDDLLEEEASQLAKQTPDDSKQQGETTQSSLSENSETLSSEPWDEAAMVNQARIRAQEQAQKG